MTKRMTEVDRAFYQGFALGMATLIRAFDQPSMAADICSSNGIDVSDLKAAKVDLFDMKPLAKALRER